MSNLYIGIDPSMAKSGVVVLNDRGVVEQATVVTTKSVAPYRGLGHKAVMVDMFGQIETAVTGSVRGSSVLHVAVEEPLLFGYGAIWRAALYGCLCLRWMPMSVNVKHLKMFGSGSGSASKRHMAVGVQQLWGFKHKSDDVIDAYVLAQMARARYVPGVYMVDYQRYALEHAIALEQRLTKR